MFVVKNIYKRKKVVVRKKFWVKIKFWGQKNSGEINMLKKNLVNKISSRLVWLLHGKDL